MNVRPAGFSLTLLLVAVLAGCASAPVAAPTASVNEVYTGAGRGATLGEAINAAKMNAVQKAVVELIGADAEQQHRAELEEVLYQTRNPNAFVFNETMETLRRDGSLLEENLYYEIQIRVNMQAVRATLSANNIPRSSAASTSSPQPTQEQSAADGDPVAATRPREGSSILAPVEDEPVTPDEERFISRYVDRMTYMVYYSDRSVERMSAGFADPEFLMTSAVTQANAYLAGQGSLVVDAGQVERLKEDQRLIYEEQSGQALSLLQWVARGLNADVYIELDAEVSGTLRNGNYYGTADVTLNMFETSTGQIMGSVVRQSPETFSRVSIEDAVQNALSSTVYQAMPFAVSMAQDQMERMLTRGIRYELTLQSAPDARTLSRFRSEMNRDTRGIATVSSSPGEVLYEIFFIGSTDDLIDMIFSVSDRVAGLEDIDLVVSRGRSLVFDAGL
ncbi:MAG: hypothetical protein ACLFP4_02260 [Spirochaetales bacterium]